MNTSDHKTDHRKEFFMKRLKFLLPFVALLLLSALLVGCSAGISGESARVQIEGFFAAVSAGDLDEAQRSIHPSTSVDVRDFLASEEARLGISFGNGVEVKEYTGFSSSVYDSKYRGSQYTLHMKLTVGGEELISSVTVVSNDRGMGIYSVSFSAK